ncbi:MAG: tRNA pseudouridine(38-40) synthase TruA [Sphingobacteriales bacterium]|nr:tRNA pseudouridine(38-40) synthase TruA [Sphingobacteriales bacterium]
MKNRYFLEIAYLGSHFHGWQIQPGSISVQQVMNEHISLMLGEKINCMGCGRTDAGVHARKFFLHFDTSHSLTSDFRHKLNSFLPLDILVRKMYACPQKIHARWDALSRTYEYLICKGKNPFYIDLALFSYEKFDTDLMNKASAMILKNEDFTTFSKAHGSQKNQLCRVTEAYWTETDEFYIFRITANRFVRSMVRLLAGTLLDVGRQKITPSEFEERMLACDRSKAGKSLPACGLYLINIEYPENFLIEMAEHS